MKLKQVGNWKANGGKKSERTFELGGKSLIGLLLSMDMSSFIFYYYYYYCSSGTVVLVTKKTVGKSNIGTIEEIMENAAILMPIPPTISIYLIKKRKRQSRQVEIQLRLTFKSCAVFNVSLSF